MNPLERVTFTRAELQGLKAELEQQQLKQDVAGMVAHIRAQIISAANQGKRSVFKSVIRPEDKEDRLYTIIMTVIDKLCTMFPGVDIKYDVQTCIRTGKKMNQGIYVDWS
jgi:hypothetical protein